MITKDMNTLKYKDQPGLFRGYLSLVCPRRSVEVEETVALGAERATAPTFYNSDRRAVIVIGAV